MDGYLDYKATVWFRIPIQNKQALEKVKEKIQQGMLPSELYDDLDIEHDLGTCEPLYATEQFISPNENDGQSTIEIYKNGDNDIQIIWDNSYESEIKRKKIMKITMTDSEYRKDDIELIFINLITRMEMDIPKNYEDIVQYIYEDVLETADPINWSVDDVVIGFRRWIESKT